MKLSIALATCNGERFLGSQLQSISKQSRPPDEVVVRDDDSSDRTLELVHKFADSVPFPVQIEKASENRGSTHNFAHAISACRGDIIALCDQDDVWLPNKLERLVTAFQQDAATAFVFSDAEVVDDDQKPLGYRLWDALRFGERDRERFRNGSAFESLLRRHRVTGATLAFRSAFRDRILPIPDGWVHDAWVALLLSAIAPCSLIPEPLIHYRQHNSQQHGGRMRTLRMQFQAAQTMTRQRCEAVADRFEEAWDRLRTFPEISAERLDRIRQKIDHHRRRALMRDAGIWRLPHVVAGAVRGDYSRFDQGWKTIAQDLLLN
jgi:glycosyltransferase involved in cell wall biosynthesis